MSLAACDNAVQMNQRTSYIVKGDAHSMLYPLSVTRDSEDVHIQMRDEAPVPEVVSFDSAGRAEPFNFAVTGHMLVMPGKFDRIELRHQGAAPIDIISGDTVR